MYTQALPQSNVAPCFESLFYVLYTLKCIRTVKGMGKIEMSTIYALLFTLFLDIKYHEI